jgi:uncharacterized RDD family membrane protein YckC
MGFIIQGDDGENYGPVDLKELRNWVRENRAGLGTKVRTEETGSLWQPWQYYPELVALLAESRAGANPVAGSILAPLGRRILAFAADLVLIYFLLCPLFLLIYLLCPPEIRMLLTQSFNGGQYTPPQLPSGYETLFELVIYGVITLYMAGFHAAHGKTPAKAILRLRVVDEKGGKPPFLRSLMRGLVLTFSLCLFFFPLFYVFIHPQRRALHDLVAGTYVVEA